MVAICLHTRERVSSFIDLSITSLVGPFFFMRKFLSLLNSQPVEEEVPAMCLRKDFVKSCSIFLEVDHVWVNHHVLLGKATILSPLSLSRLLGKSRGSALGCGRRQLGEHQAASLVS